MAEEVIFNLSNFFVKTQILNYDLLAVAVATRRIKTGMEVHDSYGAVWYHMDRTERQRFLKVFFLLQKMKILFCFIIRIFIKILLLLMYRNP